MHTHTHTHISTHTHVHRDHCYHNQLLSPCPSSSWARRTYFWRPYFCVCLGCFGWFELLCIYALQSHGRKRKAAEIGSALPSKLRCLLHSPHCVCVSRVVCFALDHTKDAKTLLAATSPRKRATGTRQVRKWVCSMSSVVCAHVDFVGRETFLCPSKPLPALIGLAFFSHTNILQGMLACVHVRLNTCVCV
jgi:hypothetical protein